MHLNVVLVEKPDVEGRHASGNRSSVATEGRNNRQFAMRV